MIYADAEQAAATPGQRALWPGVRVRVRKVHCHSFYCVKVMKRGASEDGVRKVTGYYICLHKTQ